MIREDGRHKIALISRKVPASRLYPNSTTADLNPPLPPAFDASAVWALGFLSPCFRASRFLDPKMMGAYACLSVLFVAPASAEAFGSNWPHLAPSERLGKMALVIAYGWGIAVVTLATALATVNLTN